MGLSVGPALAHQRLEIPAMRIVLSGPPGSGKTIVARALAAQGGATHLTFDDAVPDRVLMEGVEARLRECGGAGFVLDGFPRSIPQAVSLEFILKRLGKPLDLVADLAVPVQAVLDRRPGEPEGTLETRLRIYREQSSYLSGHYQRKGLLLTVRETDSQAAAAQILGAVAAMGQPVVQ
jgi:adenylate kinase